MTGLNFTTSPYFIISVNEITIQNPALWLISHLKIQNLKIQDFTSWFSSVKTFNYYSILSFNQATQAGFSFPRHKLAFDVYFCSFKLGRRYTVHSGAVVGKTIKTAVLPGFWGIECCGGSSGVPQSHQWYGGLTCLRLSAAPLDYMQLSCVTSAVDSNAC